MSQKMPSLPQPSQVPCPETKFTYSKEGWLFSINWNQIKQVQTLRLLNTIKVKNYVLPLIFLQKKEILVHNLECPLRLIVDEKQYKWSKRCHCRVTSMIYIYLLIFCLPNTFIYDYLTEFLQEAWEVHDTGMILIYLSNHWHVFSSTWLRSSPGSSKLPSPQMSSSPAFTDLLLSSLSLLSSSSQPSLSLLGLLIWATVHRKRRTLFEGLFSQVPVYQKIHNYYQSLRQRKEVISLHAMDALGYGTQSVVPRPATQMSPGNLLKMQILRLTQTQWVKNCGSGTQQLVFWQGFEVIQMQAEFKKPLP